MKRRSLLKAASFLLVMGIVVVLVLAPWGRAPNLRNVGKPIPMPRGDAIFGYPQHLWISEREQIGFLRYNLPGLKIPSHPATMAIAFDTESGRSYQMQSLSQRLFPIGKKNEPWFVSSWQPSTDGKWISLDLYDHTLGHHSFGFVRTDGSAMKVFPTNMGATNLYWNPMDGNLLVMRRDIEISNERAPRPSSYSYNPDNPDRPRLLPIQQIDCASCRLGVTSRGRILDVMDWAWNNMKPDAPVTLRETDPQAPDGAQKSWTIQPPRGKVAAISLSSKGDKLAWLINTHNAGPKIGFLRRTLHMMGYKTSDTISLWISTLNGSVMREIGTTNVPRNVTSGSLSWSPSDKKISFAFTPSELWVVPVK